MISSLTKKFYFFIICKFKSYAQSHETVDMIKTYKKSVTGYRGNIQIKNRLPLVETAGFVT